MTENETNRLRECQKMSGFKKVKYQFFSGQHKSEWKEFKIEVEVNDDIEVNKKKFHVSKQAITIHSVNINKIVTSDKGKHSDNGYK